MNKLQTPFIWQALAAAGVMLTLLQGAPAHANNPDCTEPNVLILLDVSGSMNQNISGKTMYRIAQEAIHSVTLATEADIRYGLMLFPEPGPSPVHCNTSTTLAVNFGLNNWAPIFSYLSPTLYNSNTTNPAYFGGPKGHHDTPMYQALNNAGELAGLLDSSRRNYVLLITDGVQDCCNSGDYNDIKDCDSNYSYTHPNYHVPDEYARNRQDLIDTVTGLRNQQNIDTFVVGFGSLVDPITLSGMAIAAGTEPSGCNVASNNCYYQANNQDDLRDALDNIALIVREEVCDGIDNNCSGVIDDGVDIECETECGTGYLLCIDGNYQACNAPQPQPEICDGLDNNCNGEIDEGCECVHGDTQACGTSVGVCEPGQQTCVMGAWGACEGGVLPSPEQCDGVDNDCDGVIDEGCECQNGDSRRCGTSVGECETGLQVCINGAWGPCEGAVWPAADDPCDGLDNNCNGIVDEYCTCIHGDSRACGSSQGQCEPGHQACSFGDWSECLGETGPTTESCNNQDDDCDGYVDNGAICPGSQACRCGSCVGPCASDGSCNEGGECINGFCVIDECPEGFYCDGYTCAAGNPPGDGSSPGHDGFGNGEETGGGSPPKASGVEGCRCSGGANPASTSLLLLLIFAGHLVVRRRWI